MNIITPQIGDIIKLVPHSAKGKNRVKRDGNVFKVLDVCQSARCQGMAMFVEPPNKECRWVALSNDPDFDWEVVPPNTTKLLAKW